jgi:hypothetical protein
VSPDRVPAVPFMRSGPDASARKERHAPDDITWARGLLPRDLQMRSVIFGLVMVVGGLSGKLALRGTGSSTALVVLGFCLLGWGIYQQAAKARE